MLRDMLKGLVAHYPQAVGNMIVIPLTGQENERDEVGTMADIYLNRDLAYDRLSMKTESTHPTIMPSGYTLITKESAQDRAVANKTLIPAKGTVDVNAFCVQSSQAGHMQAGNRDKQAVRMLPLTVRKAAYNHRNLQSYNSLWETLGAYNRSLSLNGDFLKTFFENFKVQLEQFIAEFELLPYQRGAIILINNDLVGVEIAANPMAFSAQWELLIRDCYGSEAIAQAQDEKKVTVDQSVIFGNAGTLEDLEDLVLQADEKEMAFAEDQVDKVLQQQATCTSRQQESGMRVVDMETEEFVGQAVQSGDDIIDLTLLRRDIKERPFGFRRRRN